MTEIDMNKVSKAMCLKSIEDLIKKPKLYVTSLGISSCAVATEYTSLIPDILLLLLGYYNFSRFSNDIKNIIDINRLIVDNVIRETEEYKVVIQLYKEYIFNISQLFKDYDFKDSIDKTLYIDELIHSGTLSMNGEFKYKIYKNESKYIPELLGARITSGNGVCRHISGLTTDLLTSIEIESFLVEVRKLYCTHPEIFKFFPFNISNHVVVGSIENDQKYIFDPTHHDYATVIKNSHNFMKNKNQVTQVVKDEKPYEMHISYGDKGLTCIKMPSLISGYYHINENYRLYNYEKDRTISKFEQASWKKIENEEIEKRKEIISKLFDETEYERQRFYQENKDLMTELALMDSILSPYSDEEKPRWVLHKS